MMTSATGRRKRAETKKSMWYAGPTRLALLTVCAAGLMGGSAIAQTYVVTDLGTLGGAVSIGRAINAAGQVTGAARTTGDTAEHAFMFNGAGLTDLGSLGGNSVGAAINTAGEVTGVSFTASYPEAHAFLHSRGVMTDLGTLGGTVSNGLDINDTGQVTGYAFTAGNAVRHAFLYSGGVMTGLGTLGGPFSIGRAINATGQVTGEADTADRAWRAFVYSGGVMKDLGALGGKFSAGFAINDAGQVTGVATTAGDSEGHAFLYSNGIMTDLGTLGGTASSGSAINAAGQVTGVSLTAGDSAKHAFLYSNGVMKDIGSLGGPQIFIHAINASGHVVGTADISPWENHAFLYRGGASMIDLNTLVAGSGWTLRSADGINDSGQITGWGYNGNGEGRAFLLTPVVTTQAQVEPPIDADGSSVFNAKRGVIPVRFTLTVNGTATCELPPATIAVTRTASATIGAVGEGVYMTAADQGSGFRIADCQYIYNLEASSLGLGHYRVDIAIDGNLVGHAEFSLR